MASMRRVNGDIRRLIPLAEAVPSVARGVFLFTIREICNPLRRVFQFAQNLNQIGEI